MMRRLVNVSQRPPVPPHARRTGRRTRRLARPRRAFTLVEAMIVTMIVGVGTTAVVQLLASGTVATVESIELTKAVNLASSAREMALGLEFRDPEAPTRWSTRESSPALYDDLLDLDGVTFSPPLDAGRAPMAGYEGWAQRITVDTVSPGQLTATVADDATQPMALVTVVILHEGAEVYRMNWVAVAPGQ